MVCSWFPTDRDPTTIYACSALSARSARSAAGASAVPEVPARLAQLLPSVKSQPVPGDTYARQSHEPPGVREEVGRHRGGRHGRGAVAATPAQAQTADHKPEKAPVPGRSPSWAPPTCTATSSTGTTTRTRRTRTRRVTRSASPASPPSSSSSAPPRARTTSCSSTPATSSRAPRWRTTTPVWTPSSPPRASVPPCTPWPSP